MRELDKWNELLNCQKWNQEKTLKLEIEIKPVPKGRPRFYNGRVITPKKTKDFEKRIADEVRMFIANPLDGEVSLSIHFQFKHPKKSSRSYPSIGDLDNYTKCVLDSLNGVLYKDDVQIVFLACSKYYGKKDLITIETLGNNAI